MTKGTSQGGRKLSFEIFRYNPEDPESVPHMQTFEIEETPYMSLFIALNHIRETQDPSLQFDFACRSAICGSCGMMVNGERFYPEHAMTREEALRTYTLNNAIAAFEEDIKGTLTPGKYADIVVLSQDLLTVEEDRIPDTQVDITIVGGEVKYTRGM